MGSEKTKMITAKEYAETHDVHYTTVMNWLRRELLPGAVKEDLPFGGYFYMIPANVPVPSLKPGPKPKNADEGKAGKRTTDKGTQTLPFEPATATAKPKARAKKAGAKKAAKKKGVRVK